MIFFEKTDRPMVIAEIPKKKINRSVSILLELNTAIKDINSIARTIVPNSFFVIIILIDKWNIKIYLLPILCWKLPYEYIRSKIENYINTPSYFRIMLRIKKISAMIGKRVFTDTGDFFGEVEEAILAENKIDSWRIRVSRPMARNLNGARGVIIPHQFVKAIGDVIVVNGSSLPITEMAPGLDSEENTVDLSTGNKL